MRWSLLGPVEVAVAGRVLDIRRPQQRGVLALLLLNADRLVPAERIGSALWGEHPPDSARTQVQVCISKIRAELRRAGLGDALCSRAGGYRLAVGDGLDLAEFTAAVREARLAAADGRPAVSAELLRGGLALWRGPALAGAAGVFVEPAAAALGEQRLAAYEALADAELALGHHDALVQLLRPLADAHPLREHLVARLMLALVGCGRQAEALGLFAETRARLRDELGVAPCTELTDAHLGVLRSAVPGVRAVTVHLPAAPVPAQLPTDVAGFAGRGAALGELDALLGADVVIEAVGGTAGIGKTTLAVHWAHRVAHRFPDGQLYLNLRGFDPGGRAVTPGEALRGFLDALGVPPQRVPAELTHQIGLYRSVISGRRMLLVLDNAHDADQVRPLLPGAPDCRVVVTSRNRLSGLVVAEGARSMTLDLLPVGEAEELLTRRIGPQRAAAEPGALRDIAERCARLPLALAIVAARAADRPGHPLAVLADELAGPDERLEALHAGDPDLDMRRVFSWSYEALDEPAARLFRLLGLHPGPDLALPAIASLAGTDAASAATKAELADLIRAHLVAEPTPGRYGLHDLLRAYAAEWGRAVDGEHRQRAASRRMVEHYLHAAHAADLLIDPHRLAEPVPLPPPAPGVVTIGHRDHEAATSWCAAERRVLLAVVVDAARTGLDGAAWRLAASLTTFLDRRGHWHDLADVQQVALAAARRDGDRSGQAHAHRGLAICATWFERHAPARAHYEEVLRLYSALGDDAGLGGTHIGICWTLARQGRHEEALHHAELALRLYESAGSTAGQAKSLNNIGWLHARLGNLDEAVGCCRRALALHRRTGDRHGAALTWDSLGSAYHRLGRHDDAVGCYRRALALHRALGDRYDEGDVLTNLGDAELAGGDPAAAEKAWRQALEIYESLQHPDTGRLLERLSDLREAVQEQ